MFIPHVYQFNLMMETVFVVLITREDEVQNTNSIHIVQVEVPVTRSALLNNWESGVKYAAVFEEILTGLLHFHDELLTILTFAIDIKNGTALAK